MTYMTTSLIPKIYLMCFSIWKFKSWLLGVFRRLEMTISSIMFKLVYTVAGKSLLKSSIMSGTEQKEKGSDALKSEYTLFS